MPPRTEGISPKVSVPTVTLALLGVVLLIASLAMSGSDSADEMGLTLLGASLIVGLLGYNADP